VAICFLVHLQPLGTEKEVLFGIKRKALFSLSLSPWPLFYFLSAPTDISIKGFLQREGSAAVGWLCRKDTFICKEFDGISGPQLSEQSLNSIGAVNTYDFVYESAYEFAYDLPPIRFPVRYYFSAPISILNWTRFNFPGNIIFASYSGKCHFSLPWAQVHPIVCNYADLYCY
jgi:hypothetical protein